MSDQNVPTEVIQAINRVASTNDGIVFFRYLMTVCGFKSSNLVLNPQTNDLNITATLHNESMRCVYLGFRGVIDPIRLDIIESNSEVKNENS